MAETTRPTDTTDTTETSDTTEMSGAIGAIGATDDAAPTPRAGGSLPGQRT